MRHHLLKDFRGQLSWGRACSFVALVVAVVGQFKGMEATNLAMWLGVAVGNYAASKFTEALCVRSGEVPKAVE